MAHEKLRPEYFFDEAKIEQLKQLTAGVSRMEK